MLTTEWLKPTPAQVSTASASILFGKSGQVLVRTIAMSISMIYNASDEVGHP
jgi:hypothetical protein